MVGEQLRKKKFNLDGDRQKALSADVKALKKKSSNCSEATFVLIE